MLDFKIMEDEFGYYVIGYRIHRGVEQQYNNIKLLAQLFDMSTDDMREYIYSQYDSDEKSKNYRMHFQSYEKAVLCVEGFRKLLVKAIQTGHLFLPT